MPKANCSTKSPILTRSKKGGKALKKPPQLLNPATKKQTASKQATSVPETVKKPAGKKAIYKKMKKKMKMKMIH